MNIKRREFLKQSALGVGGLLVGAQLGQAEAAAAKSFDPYAMVTLGKTGLKFSRVCMGTGMRGGKRESNHTRMGAARLQALIRESYDRGVRMFDLADVESNGHRVGGFRALYPAYDRDGGHLTVEGQDAVARALVLFVAGLFP